jgi:small subunit ribosomal protein S2
MAIKISLKDLLETGAHFGHQSRRWNPKMKPYLYEIQHGVHVFDLTKTKDCLDKALKFLSKAASLDKKILFVGTKKQAKEKIKEAAEATDSFYIDERWLGGILTNFSQIQKSIKKLSDMKEKREAGGYKSFTKKERALIDREILRLERFFGGLSGMEKLPDILIVVDIRHETGAVKEAEAMGVDTVGIVDSNSDPTRVTYPIPMNDDASKAIAYTLELIQKAVLEGAKKKGKIKTK